MTAAEARFTRKRYAMMKAKIGGVELHYEVTGDGEPVVFVHGFPLSGRLWDETARALSAEYRCIVPDLRGHGDSAKPHDPAAYPPDALMRDGLALIAHLGLADYDLGGYSLGGRTTVRMLVNGAMPRRVVLSGMGLSGILHTEGRGSYFRKVLTHLGSFERGSAEWLTEAFLKTTKGDPTALLNILGTFVDTSEAELRAITQPALVATGIDDDDNGSGAALAATLPNGSFVELPGNHMSAVTKPELGRAIATFLAA